MKRLAVVAAAVMLFGGACDLDTSGSGGGRGYGYGSGARGGNGSGGFGDRAHRRLERQRQARLERQRRARLQRQRQARLAALRRERQRERERELAAAPAPSNCTDGYDPCLPPASDYDCEGGSGDGPAYTGYVTVTGSDPYDLDADGDGVGCES